MHLHTIVKIKATDAESAVDVVNHMMEDYGYDGITFDYFDDEYTKVIEMTDEEFSKLREDELKKAQSYLERAAETNDLEDKGLNYICAGECMRSSQFNSVERYAYDAEDYYTENEKVFYVETDRHF